MYDIIISGSGPSGSTAASTAAKAGLKVVVFEKHKLNPRYEKPCGGSVPKHVWDEFKIPHKNYTERQIFGNLLSAPSNEEFVLKSEPFFGWNVKRSVFDKFLADRATDSGAEILEQSFVKDLIIEEDFIKGVKVKTSSGTKEYRANITIAADGVGSRIVSRAGLREKWKREQLGFCAVAFVTGYIGHNGDFSNNLFYLSNEIAPNAYAWVFPFSENLANVGLGLFKTGGNPMEYLYNFLKWPRIKKQFKNSKFVWKSNFPIPIQGISKKLFTNGFMGVGDSVGFVSPVIGEGISYGMSSGKLAAETAIEAIEKDDYSTNILKKYKKRLRKENLFSIFSAHKMFRDLLMEDLNRNINAIIQLANSNSDVQKLIKLALTEEGVDDIPPELLVKILDSIKDVLNKK
ncbi:MAG: geranylgeranyl reductase family protein [Candidatus Helarchaeota archaeon]